MLSSGVWNRCLVRTFTRSVVRKNLDKSKTPETTSTTTSATTTPQPQRPSVGPQDLVHDVLPTEWDKKLLMWSGRYKTPEDIPRRVTLETMNAVKSKLRIKVATVLMVLILIGCFVITRIGKANVSRGDSLLHRQKEKERRLREEGRQALLNESTK